MMLIVEGLGFEISYRPLPAQASSMYRFDPAELFVLTVSLVMVDTERVNFDEWNCARHPQAESVEIASALLTVGEGMPIGAIERKAKLLAKGWVDNSQERKDIPANAYRVGSAFTLRD